MNLLAAIAWAHSVLAKHGVDRQSDPVILVDTPWSCVARFDATDQSYYLKLSAPEFSLESEIMIFLEEYSDLIPHVFYKNNELNGFITQEAGVSLRGELRKKFNVEQIHAVLSKYAMLQIGTLDQVDQLLDMGIRDFRLDFLMEKFEEFLEKKSKIIQDGFSENEYELLIKQLPLLTEKIKSIEKYNIPMSIEHGDFQDNNILLHIASIKLMDWAESTITHPFVSAHNFFQTLLTNFNDRLDPSSITILKQAYLNPWEALMGIDLDKIFDQTKFIYLMTYCLGFDFIVDLKGIDKLQQYKGRIAGSLRKLLDVINEK